MEDLEQAAPELESTSAVAETGSAQSIEDILGSALTGKEGSPEDSVQTEEGQDPEQPAAEQVVETPYGEITLDEAKKIAFKDEKEFQAFLDKNPFLKQGFLRQSDYTRKTTQVSEERKKFEQERKEFETQKTQESEAWGKVKPSTEDMAIFHNLWTVYQHGSDTLANQISAFARDISLIANGKNPIGPLAGQNGQAVDYSKDSQVISVRRELDQYKAEQERKEREFEAREMQRQQEEATRTVNTWLADKAKQGINITMEERKAMALFSQVRDETGERISLDEMYRLGLAKLGRTEKDAIKKVFTGTKEHARKTPQAPASKVPSSSKPEAETLDEILNQGLEELKG